ncbi:hypothetical protein B0J18DRAFT_424919 [Chaetomium sp. MPI-SDFR-AT-0129]|nr:hypothetical protein B0J18DRAFT_424919 [Chaetomium sp. MPI-SDFR-AT-0129]
MATKGHTRSRSSIDRVIDLLADLEETQITHLLDDLNHTTSSNVPVTDAIALFDRHVNKPSRQRSVRSPEPLRTLQAELERRHSKRMSAAPSRFRSAAGTAATSSVSSTQPRASLDHISVSPARARSPPPPAVSELPTIELPSFELPPMDFFDRPSSPLRAPSLRLSSPEPVSIDGEDDEDEDDQDHEQDHLDSRATSISRSPSPSRPPPSSSATFRPRSYKRISRPIFLSPTATAELHLLLLAFFNEATPVPPVSPTTTTPAAVSPTTTSFTGIHPTTTRSIPSTVATTTATPSPTTPLFSGFSHSPIFRSHFFDDDEDDMEPTTPGLEDLLEPSPVRASSFSAMGGLGPNGGGNGSGGGGLGVGGGLGGGLGLRKGSAGGRSLKTMPSISSMFDLMKP